MSGSQSPNKLQKQVDAAVNGAFSLIGLQLISRVVTFVINTLIVRKIEPEVYGIYSVQYQLVMSTILALTREGIRRACLRFNVNSRDPGRFARALQQLVNLAWLTVPLGLVLSFIVRRWFLVLFGGSETALYGSAYEQGLDLFVLASQLEIISEPGYILVQNFWLSRVRLKVEGAAVVLRAATTYVCVLYGYGLRGFGYSQVLYAVVLCCGYYGYFVCTSLVSGSNTKGDKKIIPLTSGKQLLPSLRSDDLPSRQQLWLTFVYFWQSLEKFILSEGEKYVLMWYAPLLSQATYSIVNNLGSLVARILFQPIEETTNALFSQLFTTNVASPSADRRSNESSAAVKAREGGEILRKILKFMILIGFLFLAFGPNYASLLLSLLYGNKFSHTNAAEVLAWYCAFVAIMAVNGTTEAFVYAVATAEELSWYNVLLVAFTSIYLATAALLINLWHTPGLILANCLNMLLRITYSLWFIRRFFLQRLPQRASVLSTCLPSGRVTLSFVFAYIVTHVSYLHLFLNGQLFQHVLVGAVCLLGVIASLYFLERTFLLELLTLRRRKQA